MTLRKLAAALAVPVFRFFLPADTAAASVVRRGELKTLGLARTGARNELLTPSLQGQLEIMEISMDPGQAYLPRQHPPPASQHRSRPADSNICDHTPVVLVHYSR